MLAASGETCYDSSTPKSPRPSARLTNRPAYHTCGKDLTERKENMRKPARGLKRPRKRLPSSRVAKMEWEVARFSELWCWMGVCSAVIEQGFIHRSRVRALRAQGLVRNLYQSERHLLVLADFTRLHPPDVNIYVFHTWLSENCQKYFPGHHQIPPVVCLDLWPMSDSLAIIRSPEMTSQFTPIQNLPKAGMVKKYIRPLTSGIDIFCIEEVLVFVTELEKFTGENETWGSVLQLEQKTINLTFDVICRATMYDMRLHEQTNKSPSPLKVALLDQLRLMGIMTNAARAIFLGHMPWHTAAIAKNNKTMKQALLPQIETRLKGNSGGTKIIIDLTVQSFKQSELGSIIHQPGFVTHDTTSSTIRFMYKLLQDNPRSLAILREEHDNVLSADLDKAAQVISESPHLLSSLPSTLDVIKETLRLYTEAATIRHCHGSFYLTDASNRRYPMEGFEAWMLTPEIHRSPQYWPNPDEFLPERWIAAEGDPLHPTQSNAWVPFSTGPRNCIGMELAMIELKLVLAMTARAFDVEEAWHEWDQRRGSKATPSHTVKGQRLYQVGISTVHPKDGIPVEERVATQLI
ncbi:cytochrome P450 4V3 [Xylariaceae sp. FL1272]|nr:cytochrome P450 4V3 [Xylariaceae sp. FL1272]